MAVKIKICGITNLKDALAALKYGANALGFVLVPSPRRINLIEARNIIKELPPFIATVAVVVNESKDNLNKIIKMGTFTALQLHGEEKPEIGKYLKNKIRVIKALRIKNEESLKNIHAYEDVDALLLDTFSPKSYGGSGQVFNWGVLKKIKNKIPPIILSGGLNPNNIALAIKKVRPYAVDVCSGVEKYPGKKDYRLLRDFINNCFNCP